VSLQIQPKKIADAVCTSNSNADDDPLVHSTNNSSTTMIDNNIFATNNQFVEKCLFAGGGDDPIGTRGESYFFLQALLLSEAFLY